MTGVGSRESGVWSRERKPASVPRAVWFAVLALLLTLPIFAHGCHRGDHDDEPQFAPIDHPTSPAELRP